MTAVHPTALEGGTASGRQIGGVWWLPLLSILDGVGKAKRMPTTEVTPKVWVDLSRVSATIDVGDVPFDFHYADVAALSRALSIVKESKQYAAWLKKEGLA